MPHFWCLSIRSFTPLLMRKLTELGTVINCRPSFLRSSITLELLDLLLTLFDERYLLGTLFVPVPVSLISTGSF